MSRLNTLCIDILCLIPLAILQIVPVLLENFTGLPAQASSMCAVVVGVGEAAGASEAGGAAEDSHVSWLGDGVGQQDGDL